jgi:hypothetical protein
MDVRGSQEYVNTRLGGSLYGVPSALDVHVSGAGQTGDRGPAYVFGDGAYGLEVAFRRDREPSLDDIDTESVKLPRHPDLFFQIHAATGRLLAIPQCGVEYSYSGPFHRTPPR